ncbi:MAG TPA: ADOP family duplicated permease [Gemmatimonadaceae bacterium]|nr:ADOP family duplicated permease [Gemmatimonadaceae bacterium]
MLRRLVARLPRRGSPSDADIARELRDHLDFEAESLAAGERFAKHDAAFAARRRCGNVTNASESVRDVWRWAWLEQLVQDLRHGWRAIVRSPAYSVALVVTLAMGIGAGTTVYTLARAIHQPFPQLPQDKLLWITYGNARCGVDCTQLSPAALVAIQRRAPSITAVGAYDWATALRGSNGSEAVKGFAVSPDTWQTIGARFTAGHGFPGDAGVEGGPNVVVLSYEFWHRRFNASLGVIDSVVTIDQQPRTVVGVLAEDIRFPTTADVYKPFRATAQDENDHSARYLNAFARLTDGATIDRASAEVATINRQLVSESPKTDSGWVLRARPIAAYHTDDVQILDDISRAAALLVFLAACMSAANLALARLSARRQELALRAALGVRRWRLARHLLAESLLLSLVAGALGALLARWGVRWLRDAIPPGFAAFLPGWARMGVDPHVLLFALGTAIVAMLAFALLPVARATRISLSSVLAEGGRANTGGVHGTQTRATLIVLEVSIALVLLTAAALFTTSVRNMIRGNAGVRLDHVLTMELTLPPGGDDSSRADFFRRLDVNLGAVPGIRAAGAGTTTPLSNDFGGIGFDVPGRAPEPGGRPLTGIAQQVTPRYMQASGVSIEEGRGIEDRDVAGAQRVLVVNRYMADALWPHTTAIGRVVKIADSIWTVVGVASNVHHGGLDEEMRYTLYRSVYQAPRAYAVLAIWTLGDPDSMRDAVRAVVARTDPSVAVGDAMTMEAMQARHVSPFTMMAGMMSVLAVVTMVIATVGLYGLIAYGVAQRTREIGVRIALGARPRDILGHVGAGALRLTAMGIVFGVAGAAAFARLLTSALYGVSASDTKTYIFVSLGLLLVALTAASVPSWRAAKVDPTVALRE